MLGTLKCHFICVRDFPFKVPLEFIFFNRRNAHEVFLSILTMIFSTLLGPCEHHPASPGLDY